MKLFSEQRLERSWLDKRSTSDTRAKNELLSEHHGLERS